MAAQVTAALAATCPVGWGETGPSALTVRERRPHGAHMGQLGPDPSCPPRSLVVSQVAPCRAVLSGSSWLCGEPQDSCLPPLLGTLLPQTSEGPGGGGQLGDPGSACGTRPLRAALASSGPGPPSAPQSPRPEGAACSPATERRPLARLWAIPCETLPCNTCQPFPCSSLRNLLQPWSPWSRPSAGLRQGHSQGHGLSQALYQLQMARGKFPRWLPELQPSLLLTTVFKEGRKGVKQESVPGTRGSTSLPAVG